MCGIFKNEIKYNLLFFDYEKSKIFKRRQKEY